MVVSNEVVPSLPADTWRDTSEPLPLRFGTDPWEIVGAALPHADGDLGRRSAVYVLECRESARPCSDALAEGVTPKIEWEREAVGSRRIIYVGYTVNLLRRLDEHLNNRNGQGAHFTRVFPPIRVLGVSWWSSPGRANRAERLVAEGLRERFPEDYVFQL